MQNSQPAAPAAAGPLRFGPAQRFELHHGYFHTVCAQNLEAGLDANGKVTAWLRGSAEPTIVSIFAPDPKTLAPFELGLGPTGRPYAIPNARIGWLRSVNNIQHVFAAQSFIADIAPALMNAIAAATGKRVRQLPLQAQLGAI